MTEACRLAKESLLQHLLAPWQRRGTSLLLIGLEHGIQPEFFWDAGFDVTVLDDSEERIRNAYARSGPRVEYRLGRTDYQPFEDNEFACTVWPYARKDFDGTLAEARRVSSRGVIVLVRNALFPGMRKNADTLLALSPIAIWRACRRQCSRGSFDLRAAMFFPPLAGCAFNRRVIGLPLGAYLGARMDFNDIPFTPLSLLTDSPRRVRQGQTVTSPAFSGGPENRAENSETQSRRA